LNGTINCGDPHVYSPDNLGLAGSNHNWLKVYITYSPGPGTATPFQLFYNSGNGIREADSFRFTVHPGTELYQVHIPRAIAEQGKTNMWTGRTISRVRFDLGSHASGTFNIHWLAIENYPHPDWDFNITPAGVAHPSGWYVANQLANWQVTNDRKLQFTVTGGDPHFAVAPLAFDPASYRYVYMRHEVAGFSSNLPQTAQIFGFPGTGGTGFVWKNWGYYPNVGYETVVVDMHTGTSNASWNGAYGSISTFRVDPATSADTSGTHRYDRIGIYPASSIDSGTRLWNSMSGPGAWIAPKHGSYAGSTVSISGGVATLSRTGSNPFGVMNIDFAVQSGNRYLYLDVEPVTSTPRDNVAMTVQWRVDGADFAAQNRQRRYTNLRGGQGMNRHVFDLGATQASPYNGAWSGIPHGLLLHFDHAADLTSVRIANVGLVSSVRTITATAGANGSIWPSGSVLVVNGSNATFSITPSAGYRVFDVLVNSSRLADPVTSYTFTNVTANQAIHANFARPNWQFDTPGYREGWTPNAHIGTWNVAAGILQYATNFPVPGPPNPDPYWPSQALSLPRDQFSWLKVRARNATNATRGQMFFATDLGGFSEPRSVSYDVIPNDTTYRDYWVSLDANANWLAATTITQLRNDLPSNPTVNGTIYLDQILLSPTPPPSATLSSGAPNPTNAAIPVAVTLNLSSSDFTEADIAATNATVVGFSGSGTSYSFTLNPTAQGAVSCYASAYTFTDAAGNLNPQASNTISRTYDTVPPNAPSVTSVLAFTNDTTPTWNWSTGGGGNGQYRYGWTEGVWIAENVAVTQYTPPAPLADGPHTLYVQERDAAGNWSMPGSFTVTVDGTPPTAPDPGTDVEVYLNANGTATLTPAHIAAMGAGAADANGIDWAATHATAGPVIDFDCTDLNQAIAVTFTVTDTAGNPAANTTTANAIVRDAIPPQAVPRAGPISVYLSSPTLTGQDLDLNSSDNCAVFDWKIDDQDSVTYTCGDVGATLPAKLTVFDESGNNHSAFTSVRVYDDIPPVAICTNVTLQLDALGNATLAAADVDDGSNDACGPLASLLIKRSADPDSAYAQQLVFGCGDRGAPVSVTLQVTDGANPPNTATCPADVTVEDNVKPVIVLNGANPMAVMQGQPYNEPGAVANDNCDGPGNTVTDITGTVDTSVLGASYEVRYNYTDESGNAADEVVRTVNVVENPPPEITILGDNPATVECTGVYTDAGATAFDVPDGDLTDDIITTGVESVDTATPGSYTVSYEVTDSNDTTVVVSRTVEVVDTTPPVISLIGGDTAQHECSTDYVDLGAVAEDDCEGVLATPVTVTSPVNRNSPPGTYLVLYDVSDATGNAAAQITRTVEVVDTTPPVLVLLGSPAVVTECGQPYTDAGAIANDSCGGDLTGEITVDNPVSADSGLGFYTVTYYVLDAAGNAATPITRQVEVRDTTPPLLTLNGAATVIIFRGTSFTDPRATAVDGCDAGVAVVTGGDLVNTAVPGTYTITYDAQDSSGNAAPQVTRTVQVIGTGGPPAFLEQPVDQTVHYGDDAVFSVVVVVALETLTYEWRKDGVPLTESAEYSGVNTRTLTVNNADNAKEGLYRCTVANAEGTATSQAARLTVLDPAIIGQPLGQALAPGQTAAFTLEAVGSGTLVYQWFKSPSTPLADAPGKIVGSATHTLQILDAQNADEGLYFCEVTGADGTLRSQAARLRVGDPIIITDPQSQTVPPGVTVQFSVEVAGTPPLLFRWRKDGAGLSDGGRISGSSTTTLTITNVQKSDEGNYTIAVVGQNTAESNPAVLRIGDAPVIGGIVMSPADGNVPVSGYLALTVVMAGGDTPFSYQWYKDDQPLADDARISGSNGPTLNIVGTQPSDAGQYKVTVTNVIGSATSQPVSVIVGLRFIKNLSDAVVEEGDPFIWSVEITGAIGFIDYQWLKEDAGKALLPLSDGPGLSGSNSNTLVFEAVDYSDAGLYAVEVTDSFAVALSRTAKLEVVEQLPIATSGLLAVMASTLAALGALRVRPRALQTRATSSQTTSRKS